MKIKDLLPVFEKETLTVSAADVVVPDQIIYASGDGSFKKIRTSAEAFKNASAYFAYFTRQNTVMFTEISKEQYEAAVNNYESVQYIFRYDIPFGDYCNYYNIKKSAGFNSIGYLSTLALSSAAKDSILVEDVVNNAYYRFISDQEMDPLSVIANADFLPATYYPSENILGVEGSAILSISDTPNMLNAGFVPEYLPDNEEVKLGISENFFGETFDFVRRISDSKGNTTYIYRYGQKSLNFSVDGTIEYRCEAEEGESKGFFEDLAEAISGIEKCGGYNSAQPYVYLKLAAVSENENGRNKVRTFYFTHEYDGLCVYGDYINAVTATVTNGQLSALRRRTIDVISIIKGKDPTVSPINAIAVGSEDLFAGRLSDVRIGFFSKDGILTPVYVIESKDRSRVFVDFGGGLVK